MGRIIEFPLRSAREWAKVENVFRTWTGIQGCSEEAINSVCLSLKTHFVEFGNSVEFSYSIKLPNGLSDEQEQELKASIEYFAEHTQSHINIVVADALLRIGRLEIQLYEANHRKD